MKTEQSRLTMMDWQLQQWRPLEGAPAEPEQRWVSEEYSWAAHPGEGFVFTYSKADQDGPERWMFSRMWIETGSATWANGDVQALERLIIEDVELYVNDGDWQDESERGQRRWAAAMFERHAVPRLADLGKWKQVFDLKVGDTVLAWERADLPGGPRTIGKIERDLGNYYTGPRRAITWENTDRSDVYWSERAWVAVEPGEDDKE